MHLKLEVGTIKLGAIVAGIHVVSFFFHGVMDDFVK